MQIQYNITRIEEWCQSKDMPEGTLQLEHLMQATKLLQLKKVHTRPPLHCPRQLNTHLKQAHLSDIEIIFDVCWMLTPTQIQKLISHYYVADYEVSRLAFLAFSPQLIILSQAPISAEVLKAVASRVMANDKNGMKWIADTSGIT